MSARVIEPGPGGCSISIVVDGRHATGATRAELRDYARQAERDRVWFLARPGRSYRLRPIVPSERTLLGEAKATHVVVRQLVPGRQLRRPARIIGFLPNEDAVLARMFAGEMVVVGQGGSA